MLGPGTRVSRVSSPYLLTLPDWIIIGPLYIAGVRVAITARHRDTSVSEEENYRWHSCACYGVLVPVLSNSVCMVRVL
jgi:hypothetical protein